MVETIFIGTYCFPTKMAGHATEAPKNIGEFERERALNLDQFDLSLSPIEHQ